MQNSQLIDATRHFDLAMAARLAAAAEHIYADPAAVEKTALKEWRVSRFCFIDIEATQCFVAAGRDDVIVCFRGTEGNSLEDWLSDLDFDLVDGPLNARVHAGFYDALSRIWHVLDSEVRHLQSDGKRLWVTGHSLGAALATLAAARWCEEGRPIAGLYTFGQPRTGDHSFARNFDFAFRPNAFRIVNNLDIVTRTPPRSMGYRHLGTFIYLNDAGEVEHDVSRWERFLTGWQGAIETILVWGGEGIGDHRMSAYRKQLENALQRHSLKSDASIRCMLNPAPAHRNRPLVAPRRRVA